MAESARYGDRVTIPEPYSIEHIPFAERHGHSRQLLWLWLAANLTIADYAIGFVPFSLGLSVGPALLALALGNILGGLVLAWSAAMGPAAGYPQMFIGRRAFGHIGGYIPAALNWLSTAGWFTVNTILGSFAIQLVLPGLPFWLAAAILVVVQTLLVIYGHNVIQEFERYMVLILGLLFAIATVIALTHGSAIGAWHPKPFGGTLTSFAIVLAVSFSYIMSWSPYASDYSRYLPEITSRSYIAIYVFIGAVVASFLTEVVGLLVAIVAPAGATPIAALKTVMGGFGAFAVAAVILGATTANVLNLYSNTMSAKVLDIRLPRWQLAIVGGVLGFVLALIGYQNFTQNYQNFLIVLDYWIMPWLAVVLLDFYVFRHREPMGFSEAVPVNWNGVIAWFIGLGVSLLFISEQFQVFGLKAHGPFATWFGDADFGYFIGFVVAGVVYVLLNRGATRSAKQ
ncbi:MAG TPA: cytosine permease [Candidatus Dormibacteraeota bacterium]|nr:cytosine permease [Candidatus Dormibacteraeota bacterium]